jgi:SAM-dependent methyltransferase
MKDAEYLRRVYNERYHGSASNWTSEDIKQCRRLASRITNWAGFRHSEGLSMLDVGCALGYYTKAFSMLGMKSFGLDYSEVAIERARKLFPECTFFHMDGFNPNLDINFDLIFCKGFSGANTHDLNKVAEWSGKYLRYLNPGGKFIFSYSTDYSGRETGEETVNWSKEEILRYIDLVPARFERMKHFNKPGPITLAASEIQNFLSGEKVKRYFYIIFSKK